MLKSFSRKTLYLIILALAVSLFVRGFLLVTSTQVADVLRMHQVAQAVLGKVNPYLIPDFYIYPPAWMFIEGLSLQMVQMFNISFQAHNTGYLILPPVAIFFLIFKFLRK